MSLKDVRRSKAVSWMEKLPHIFMVQDPVGDVKEIPVVLQYVEDAPVAFEDSGVFE